MLKVFHVVCSALRHRYYCCPRKNLRRGNGSRVEVRKV
jgi:hypothetical protein